MPSEKQNELIIGSMLGDGCLSKLNNNKSCLRICHGNQQKDYIEWKNEFIKPFSRNIITSICNSEFPNGKKRSKPSIVHFSYTISTEFFGELEKQWYLRDINENYILNNKKRIKIIPEDLKLTPLTMAIWFFDDGRSSNSHRNAHISTDSFTKKECEKLTQIIQKTFDIKSKVVKIKNEKFEIYFPTTSYLSLINLIKPFAIANSIKYKVDLSNYKKTKTRMLSRKEVEEIKIERINGKTVKEIMLKYNTSQTSVSNILNNKIWTNNRNQ